MPVIVFSILVVAAFTLGGFGIHYYEHGSLSWTYGLLALFLSTNLLIAGWEICLFLQRDRIKSRCEYWRERQEASGRAAGFEFLASRIPFRSILSPVFWADVWGAYALYDDAYTDRNTFGFNADTGNGFFTPIPTLLLYAALTAGFMPAVYTGILGLAIFWQWTYVSSLYWVSFLITGRQHRISKREVYIYVFAPNAFWVVLPIFGLYVSARLILDGNYGILGY